MFPEERDRSSSPPPPFFSFSVSTYALRDSRESIDIRGDEIGVLWEKTEKTHTHTDTQTRRRKEKEKVTSEAYHSHRRKMRGRVRRGRPFTLFYDLWLIFSSVYMNC